MDNKKTAGSSCSCTQKLEIQPLNRLTDNLPVSEITMITGTITFANRLDHFLARWGVNRMGHIVKPGLYRLGNPTYDSPVFVSANYTLSFDAVRSSLAGTDCYILVLDTKGINVWCAAGKGTFGTDELIQRITSTGLADVVRHRTLILPQLSAPGISAHEVKRRSGFQVEYGPVRASDLPEYLKTGKATPEMRRVQFPLKDRLVLTPVEFIHVALPTIIASIILYFLAGPLAALTAITTVLAGTVFFPTLLPFIPTHDFSTKGLILGEIVAIPFAVVSFTTNSALPFWENILISLALLLIMPALTAYLALNFTGCTTFTSRTGVKKEIFRYVPIMAFMAGSGIVLSILLGVIALMKVI
ncbi:mercury methylation corrinoid protein HgcA [Methanosarcina sp.]|uniref:mercury methylation corrinoid protein HgcA n=1 Tax=Methanosarcina sp. TaxID=2213 RepID=UPI0029892F9E|nr:mercury methylation corrinoid protein HgcA [Methanosarcina sp.]MDW5550677.1 mercury methylation corrinoid protein HgcA [Methanosarcina sp.]MDW5552440.1 mercury methylation corrinoid protein HgcA [Methanosarcina sp.]MDW5560171.1 mercury methylation corrinoid protein HgcA [Methanosarcina sp.]